MIYITGDLHGRVEWVGVYSVLAQMAKNDMLLIAGDFGCLFGRGESDEQKLDVLEAFPFKTLFIDGNHECFPDLFAYPVEMWHGGKVHRIRKNVLHLMRGQVFDLEGMSVFTMGGAYSIDKAYRTPGLSWWPEEMPSDEEYTEAWENLKKHNNCVDFIVSHAAPDETMEMFAQTGVIRGRLPQEMKLNTFLETVRQTVQHKHYYFGHMHMDKQLFRNQTALFTHGYCLSTGEKVWGGDDD